MDLGRQAKICILQTAYLGDVVLTTPLFRALRQAHPDCMIHAVTTPAAAPLYEGHQDLDGLHIFDKRGRHCGFNGLRKMSGELAAENFDVALCPHPSFRSALLLKLARIPIRIGFAGLPGSFLFTKKVMRDKKLHEVARILSLLYALEISNQASPALPFDPLKEESAKKKMTEAGLDQTKPIIGVNPFSIWGTKRWPPDQCADFIDRFSEKYSCQVMLVGGPNDRPAADELFSLCRNKPFDTVGLFDLRELIWALSWLTGYLTTDSGPMHIAAAIATPVIAIFGATVPEQGYAPYAKDASIVQFDLECRPCGPHGHRRCPLGHFRCMREITTDEVLLAIGGLLKDI